MSKQKVWEVLIFILLAALAAKIVWWLLAPLVPYAVIGICLLFIIGGVVKRKRSW